MGFVGLKNWYIYRRVKKLYVPTEMGSIRCKNCVINKLIASLKPFTIAMIMYLKFWTEEIYLIDWYRSLSFAIFFFSFESAQDFDGPFMIPCLLSCFVRFLWVSFLSSHFFSSYKICDTNLVQDILDHFIFFVIFFYFIDFNIN